MYVLKVYFFMRCLNKFDKLVNIIFNSRLKIRLCIAIIVGIMVGILFCAKRGLWDALRTIWDIALGF